MTKHDVFYSEGHEDSVECITPPSGGLLYSAYTFSYRKKNKTSNNILAQNLKKKIFHFIRNLD